MTGVQTCALPIFIPPPNVEQLAALLRESGAEVTLEWRTAGHGLTAEDIDGARRWLAVG